MHPLFKNIPVNTSNYVNRVIFYYQVSMYKITADYCISVITVLKTFIHNTYMFGFRRNKMEACGPTQQKLSKFIQSVFAVLVY